MDLRMYRPVHTYGLTKMLYLAIRNTFVPVLVRVKMEHLLHVSGIVENVNYCYRLSVTDCFTAATL